METLSSAPCFSCTVACCSAFRIYLTPFDLARIVNGLGVAAHEVCLPVQVSPDTADHRHLSFSLGEEERFLLGLRRRRTGCLFLLRVGSARRCGIHGVRPLVCRSYPLAMQGGRAVMARQALCPSSWRLSPAEQKAFTRLQNQRERESFLYQSHLESWHEDGLLRLTATGIARRAFQDRFRAFLNFVSISIAVSSD